MPADSLITSIVRIARMHVHIFFVNDTHRQGIGFLFSASGDQGSLDLHAHFVIGFAFPL